MQNSSVCKAENSAMSEKLFYFSYGSNMLAKRIHLNNSSAVRVGPGRLDYYRLDFYASSNTWHGAPATIVPTRNSFVFGAIWEINTEILDSLNLQEGVHSGVYVPVTLQVLALNTNQYVECRAFHLRNNPSVPLTLFQEAEEIPFDRRPSLTYLKTLVKGAMESGIPMTYINWLRSIKHNGIMVEVYERKLDLHLVKLYHIPPNL